MEPALELELLRSENQHLRARVRDLEHRTESLRIDADTMRHERNLAAQDLRWTIDRLDQSPAGPLLRRTDGFRRLRAQWAGRGSS